MSILKNFIENTSAIKKFWEKYEGKIILGACIVLISFISFEIGVIQNGKLNENSVTIKEVPQSETVKLSEINNMVAKNTAKSNLEIADSEFKGVVDNGEKNENCRFVGSKNSNKFHDKDCPLAKKIKEENKVCFENEQEAKNKNYIPAGCCVGKADKEQ